MPTRSKARDPGLRTHTARFVAGAREPARLPRLSHPEVAFAGRSNVGKSALLNRLVGQHALARVSKTPGRTQQINFFLVDERLTLVDLPGYGFARVPLVVKDEWKQLVESYLTARANLRAVVVLVDLRRGLQDDDAQLIDFLRLQQIAVIVVATKADKLTHREQIAHAAGLATASAVLHANVIVSSAKTGDGIAALWRAIAAHTAAPNTTTARSARV